MTIEEIAEIELLKDACVNDDKKLFFKLIYKNERLLKPGILYSLYLNRSEYIKELIDNPNNGISIDDVLDMNNKMLKDRYPNIRMINKFIDIYY